MAEQRLFLWVEWWFSSAIDEFLCFEMKEHLVYGILNFHILLLRTTVPFLDIYSICVKEIWPDRILLFPGRI